MTPFPHEYAVDLAAGAEGPAELSGEDVPPLVTAPPREFGGPGDLWSPEHLLLGAVESCFVFTFRAFALAAGFPYDRLDVSCAGVLDRVDRVTRFTEIVLRARLAVPIGANVEQGRRLMASAERHCLVTASLSTPVRLEADVCERPHLALCELC